MALSIDPLTYIISVPKADLTLVQSTPTEIYELNINAFRLDLKDWEDSTEGIVQPVTHRHNTEVSLGGLTFARVVELLPPYTITFEDGQYAVNLVGANSNLGDRVNVNQVSVRSQNSAGLLSSPAIEYSSFGGHVTLDPNSAYSGTTYPTGTPQKPVNNLADALLIASYRGFIDIELYDDFTIDSAYNLNGFTVRGRTSDIVLTIESVALVENLSIVNLTLKDSVLDGGSQIIDSTVDNVDYIDGHIEGCGLIGTITLGGSDNCVISNCYTADQDNPPIIDMGGSGHDLAMPNYSGIVTITNLNGASNEVGIGLDAGIVTLDSTVTAGTIVVSGTGVLYDNSNSSAIIDTDGLINKQKIAETVWEAIGNKVYVNVNTSNTGTKYPVGTLQYAVNNLIDAKAICEAIGVKSIYIHGPIIFDVDFIGYEFESYDPVGGAVNLNGRALVDCFLSNLTVTGYSTGHLSMENCQILNGMPVSSDLDMEDCELAGTFVVASGGEIGGDRCTSPQGAIFDLNADGNLGLANFSGVITIQNISNVASTVGLTGHYMLFLASTCTAGTGLIAGTGIVYDSSSGMTVIERTLPHAVWDTDLTEHIDSGTAGFALGVSEFDGVITIDVVNGTSGTSFPVGTKLFPVNNLADAVSIAELRGFHILNILGNITFLATDNISNYTISGEGHQTSTFTFVDGCQLYGCIIKNATVTGYDLGIVGFYDVHMINMSPSSTSSGDKDAVIKDSILEGTTVLASNWSGTLEILNCFGIEHETSTYTLDLNDGYNSVSLKKFSGNVTFVNCNNSDMNVSVFLNPGIMVLDSTIKRGSYVVAGLGILEDDSGNQADVDSEALISKENISIAVWDEVLTGATHNLPTSAGRRLRQLSSNIILEGAVISSTINTITFDGVASTADGAYDPSIIAITEGPGFGQCRLILEYNGSTKTAVIDRDWKILPDNTSTYVISAYAGREHVNEGLAQGGTINTITLNALASSLDETYTGQIVFIRSGTGEDQAEKVMSYNGTTKVATLCRNWGIIPDATSAYVMLPTGFFDGLELINRTADAIWAHDDALAIMSDLAFVKKIEGGRWIISSGQMIFYDDDNITEVARFNLTYDVDMNPIERTRV
jgi:hypothetical protein